MYISISEGRKTHLPSEHETERNTPVNNRAMELRAAVRFDTDPHLKACGSTINCRFQKNTMTLAGRVPSFYHKQLAQEVLRNLAGVEQIENRIDVSRENRVGV